ncbi:MAG: hypothetical protein HQK49_21440 [Oligoflexia bacterium]|nr:hypothetical protein [Oligoflexia bacterium]
MGEHDLKHQLMSLIPYVVNFVVFFSFIIYKVKKPLVLYFQKRADDIKASIDSSENKFSDASSKLQSLQQKLTNSANECQNIMNEAAKEVITYKEGAKVEAANKIERMKRDMLDSFETEKLQLISQYDYQLLNLVFNKSKDLIKGSEKDKMKVSKNMLELLQ